MSFPILTTEYFKLFNNANKIDTYCYVGNRWLTLKQYTYGTKFSIFQKHMLYTHTHTHTHIYGCMHVYAKEKKDHSKMEGKKSPD